MIIVTGAAGFIGSYLVRKLNAHGHQDIILIDDFSSEKKNKNLSGLVYQSKVDRKEFLAQLSADSIKDIDFIFHIGARTDTTEFDKKIFDELNINYSKTVWSYCTTRQIPLVYASSGATYGMGEHGYSDDHSIIKKLQPLNPYGVSKNEFDKWVLQKSTTPPFWTGLKFFNVYGSGEYHKGRMASVIFHAYHQIKETGKVKLFRSHNSDYEDGKQLRDFIYVKDVADVCLYMMNKKPESGIYNLGTGKARTFLDLANAVFAAMDKEPNIEFIDTPKDIRDKYQYFTEADMSKLLNTGYNIPFTSLEEGVEDYVKNYLEKYNKN